jgi:predicted transcriptional regulator
MPTSASQEQINEIIRLRESGHTTREIAEKIGVSKQTVIKYGGVGETDPRALSKEMQDKIYNLRQKEHLSITEISERVGVSGKVVSKYAGPAVTKKKRKTAGQQASAESQRKNDAAISERYGIPVEEITEKDRRKFIQDNSNAKANPYNKQLNGLRSFIERSYPEEFEEILKNSKGKNKSLTQILYHPIIRRDFGDLIDKAIENGLDLSSGATKQGTKSLETLRALRADMDGNLPSLIFGSSPQIKKDIIKHKAREFAYAADRKGNPNPEDTRLAGEWFDNLTPADKVDARAPMELRGLLNAAITTPEGIIDKNYRRVYHHNYELGQGFPHTSNQNDFSIVTDLDHRRIHADPAYTGRPPLGPEDPGFVRRTIMNLFNNPVTRTAAKALPIAGYGLAAKAADDYYKNDQPVLGTLSALQAVPVLGDVLGIPLAAAELGGLGINAFVDEYKRPDRKKRADEMNLFNMVYSP